MEQEGEGRGGGGGEENKQPKPQPPPPQQLQLQKCPRCDSLNTKFCYYNNYSLSQPRYFCKACKRYWTQGGTLRNIPVGGGSRKGKRPKNSSSSIQNHSKLQPQPPSPQEVVQNQQPNLTTLMRPSPPKVVPSTGTYQGGGVGGYLSSLAAVHSLNTNPSQPFNQSLNVVGSTNSGLLSGFNATSLGSQHHQLSQICPSSFYKMGGSDREVGSLYPTEQGSIPSSMNNCSAASHSDHWPQRQSFISRPSDASLWSTISTTSISGNSESNNRGGSSSSSLVPNFWPDLPGYGPPQ